MITTEEFQIIAFGDTPVSPLFKSREGAETALAQRDFEPGEAEVRLARTTETSTEWLLCYTNLFGEDLRVPYADRESDAAKADYAWHLDAHLTPDKFSVGLSGQRYSMPYWQSRTKIVITTPWKTEESK